MDINYTTDMTTNGQVNSCPYCSSGAGYTVSHAGICPKIRAIEYHPNGQVKRVEFRDDPFEVAAGEPARTNQSNWSFQERTAET